MCPDKHPHLHCLVTDGLISPEGRFHPIPWIDTEKLMRLFRHKLLQALLAEEKISHAVVVLLLSWKHAGFSVFPGQLVEPGDAAATQRLASSILLSFRSVCDGQALAAREMVASTSRFVEQRQPQWPTCNQDLSQTRCAWKNWQSQLMYCRLSGQVAPSQTLKIWRVRM